ncbi:DUF6691 family protein [uncultured Jannaschia sp.]|uniref:DUF6691 family protein n=1 Tax=uncultured Jannaschia sp. TaxID=293347 RepID=UPI00262B3EBA|nr:DUF6691 family protein [uncultured Jannaschia sp.]
MRLIASYIVGLVFGVGISISGMANPAKVLNFFDIAGSWDPSLAFVMGGALLVTFVGYRWVLRADGPLLDTRFLIPTRSDLDPRLIGGAALFGVGWGIAGFCPGGALPALGTGTTDVFIFVAAVIAGIWIARNLDRLTRTPTPHT